MPTYIITGANRGLGLEFVRQLSTTTTSSSSPPTIIACVRSLNTTDLTALNALKSCTPTLTIHELSPSSAPSIDTFTSHLPPTTTLPQPVILINNAGINTHPTQTALTLDPATLEAHITTNVLGPALLTQSLLSSTHLPPGSLVLNMSSGVGSFGKSILGDGKATYAISKAALNMLSRHQATDLAGAGVKVLAMDPGWVKTDMGGPDAVLELETSIGGMLAVVERVLADDGYLGTCNFLQYDGQEAPW